MKDKTLNTIRDKGIYLRGKVLNSIIEVEFMLEIIITEYFVQHENNKMYDFMCMAMSQRDATLSGKAMIVRNIIDIRYLDFNKSHPRLYARIVKLSEVRNAYAHRKFFWERFSESHEKWFLEIDAVHRTDGGNAQLNTSEVELSEAFTDNYEKECHEVISDLMELSKLIRG